MKLFKRKLNDSKPKIKKPSIILPTIRKIINGLFTVIKTFCIYIFKGLVAIFTEIVRTLSYASTGLFHVFDFFVSNIIALFSYIFYALVYIVKYTIKYLGVFFKGIFNYILKPTGFEIAYLFIAIYKGSFKTLKVVFYELPVFIYTSLSGFFDLIAKKLKILKEKLTYNIKHAPTAIKDYFSNKWNNLSLVKHYKNKKERELEVLFVDKFGKDAEKSEKKVMYRYLARNADGKLITGYFPSQSKLDVHSFLLDNGYEVYEIETNWWINFTHGEKNYINDQMRHKDLVFWLTQLSTYLKAGIPLIDAIKILAEQDKRKKYKKVYSSLIYELSAGEAFSDALAKQNKVFPPLLINMIKAAELIGDLEGTLDDMANYYQEKEVTRKQMISALTYPSIVLVFAVTVITFMVMYIVPQFKKVYDSMNAEMTGMTAFLLKLADFLRTNVGVLFVVIMLFIMLFMVLYKKVKAFRTIVQYAVMHIPVVGNIIIYNEMNLFAKTFAVLNKNNILLTDTIDILSKITTNEFYKMIMYDTISNLLRGEKMSLSFKQNWAIPELAYYMISTGEQTGQLSTMLEKVSEYYQREQRTLANTLKTMVEPILLVILAVVVGGIMISVLVPMYNVSSEILK